MVGKCGLEMYERYRKAAPTEITAEDVRQAEQMRELMTEMARELSDANRQAGRKDE